MIRQLQKIRTGDMNLDRVQDHVAGVLNPVLRYLFGALSDNSALQEQWHVIGAAGQPPFQNNWANFDGVYALAGYYKSTTGVVYPRGVIVNTPGTAANANIFTFPAGYRPAARRAFVGWNSGSNVGVRLDIDSSGNFFPTSTVAAGVAYTIDGFCFRAEQ